MFSKKYMLDVGQKACIKLIENGYIHTFEEIHNLMNTYEKVKAEAEQGLSKTMPKDFRKEPEILRHLKENLKNAEEAMRKGFFEDNYQFRINLGKYFHELEGYEWLAIHFYESSQRCILTESTEVKLAVECLQRQALLKENRGSIDIAMKYLEKARKIAIKESLDEDDQLVKELNGNLCRVYQQLGAKYLEREDDTTNARKSISLKYLRKAVQLVETSGDLETQVACYALHGKAMMKFNEDKSALKSFELYTELCEKNNDKYGICQGFFAISEIFKRAGDLEKSILALNKCQEIAKEHCFDILSVFSAVSLGQIETAKRNYLKANKYFDEAYNKILVSTVDYTEQESLKKLTKIMYGIGKAHLTFHHLINNLRTPINLLIPKLLRWRSQGGPFTENVEEKKDYNININEIEKDDQEAELSRVIEKLMGHELSQV